MAEDKPEKGPSDKSRKAWRAVLRQRIKKKKRSRKNNGWGEVPNVLGGDALTAALTHVTADA